ncbi:C-type lectin domain family 4 member G-like protein [Leptotrombidium deliense]|uniref:C-type lectin domain family 4 member G-like protein n=1 Tax=Leptotrombidium deliense TaxID=299467 RepID=A0A443S5P1_9ACAR|nr:C-type lectin domain family 4 member G-like protein [Leptotrombidium deliense]
MKVIFIVSSFLFVGVYSVTECPRKWIQRKNKCYYKDNRWTTFEERLEICRKYGGYPLSIDSQSENDFIVKHFTRTTFYLGGQRVKGTDKWKWSDGRDVTFTKWSEGEPNNANNNENCIQFYSNFRDKFLGKWNDYSCSVREGGVCEIFLDEEKLNDVDKNIEIEMNLNNE